MESIQLRHTNDLHSHLESWPRVSRYLQGQTTAQTTYKFDIGDAIDRFHPLTDATMGQANVKLMNQIGYDAVTIGNNEGLGLSHEDLNHLYDHANYPVLLANLTELPGNNQPAWAQPSHIFETEAGTKVGVIGLTAPYELTYRSVGWNPHDVETTLDRLLPRLRDQADFVVLLSHLGLPTDRELADKYDLDVIIGAHTHHVLPQGELKNGTLLAAAGRYGDHVGQIDLVLDDNHQIVTKSAQAIPLTDLPIEPGDEDKIQAFQDRGIQLENEHKIVHFDQVQTIADQGRACLQALKEKSGLDVAFCSAGLFLQDLPVGENTAEDFLASMPHSIHPMVATLTGNELKDLVAELKAKEASLLNQRVKGSGFRGKVFGQVLLSGLTYDDQGQLLYAGQVVQADKQYKLATLDHYRWVDFFHVLDDSPAEIDLNLLLRELLAKYYQEQALTAGK
ncbi:bifunctional metallophosphatase/5'-nucleotidase [Fructobacillus ficulneus]|uniref:Putative nucleotide phosphoesterase n=1 Tax=Fructobacillus ficulneus TaxID=157463 RepID=A0A0K8MKS7_9LACO|nr:bifunctional UDP-sugar hydrolase/5'-nucleotidase [Fructobacillus ficulneus]GAP00475.1 putative nucleotide phosphoesterase [Fructobacillus ficulneus]